MSSFGDISSALRTLKLYGNNLSGEFHFFWLRNCTMLEKVDLSGNSDLSVDVKFHGLAPPFQLKSLVLSGCKIDDSIIVGPNFLGTQRHLQMLDLSHGNLTGSIPNWIFMNIATLVYLNIASNSLVGSIDPMWQHQSALQMINISSNHLVGHLPTNISSAFPDLEILDVSNNVISGYLPPSLCNISVITIVNLSNNKFTGQVPTCLFTDLPSLQFLKLSNNNLGGSIFGGVGYFAVGSIYLGGNKFEGTLPSNLSGNLVIMDLHDNKLSGKLDVSLWDLSSLQVLSVASNNLTGEIYPAICKLTTLQILDVSDNKFVGSTPNCAGELQLYFLNMSRNSLSGFSHSFINRSHITVLDLRFNQLIGSLDWIHSLSQTRMLLLGGNRFGGQISPNICRLRYLNIIDLSDNRMSGSLPPCIGAISFGYHADDLDFETLFSFVYTGAVYASMDDDDPSFTYDTLYDLQGFTFSTKGNVYAYSRSFFNLMFGIDFSGNMLSGEIPWEIGNLTRVKSLNLSNNHFTGRIPSAL
jgi:Leucine-rich repeat (LRR) protein